MCNKKTEDGENFCYLSEFHLVHALSCVPVQESLAPEHGSKLFTDSFKQLLNGSAVAYKGGGHLEPARRNVTNSSLDVVRNPFHKVRATQEKNTQTCSAVLIIILS